MARRPAAATKIQSRTADRLESDLRITPVRIRVTQICIEARGGLALRVDAFDQRGRYRSSVALSSEVARRVNTADGRRAPCSTGDPRHRHRFTGDRPKPIAAFA